jgi:hypothetical protein
MGKQARSKSLSKKPKPQFSYEQLCGVAALAASGVPLTTEQAATYLQVSAGRLAIWRSQKIGPRFFLVHTRPRYLKSDLDEYVRSDKPQRKVSDRVGRPRKSRSGVGR